MEFTSTLRREDIEQLLREFAPIRIHMTPTDEDRRWLELEAPRRIEMVPGRGVRILTSGRARYDLLGIRFPIRIRKLQAVLEPVVVQAEGTDHRLAFAIDIEGGDLVAVPALLDRIVVGRVNQALNPRDTRMVWTFGETLTRSFSMPERLEPLDRLNLRVCDGLVEVDDRQVVFRIGLDASLSRHKERPTDDERR
ncbi:MAG: hypothetical protein ACOC97_01955 [Myxococcota bacterium]